MSLVYSIAIAAAILIPLAGAVSGSIKLLRLSKRFRTQLCVRCGYPLASDRCTECGTALASQRSVASRLGGRHGVVLGLWVAALTLVVTIVFRPALVVRRLPTLAMCRVLAWEGTPRSLSEVIERELAGRFERHEVANDTEVDVAGILFPSWVAKGYIRFQIGHEAVPQWKGMHLVINSIPDLERVWVEGDTDDGPVFFQDLTPVLNNDTGRRRKTVQARLTGEPPACTVRVWLRGSGRAYDKRYVFTYAVESSGKATRVK